ncbi:MAG: hypothetical protein QOE23_1540 [Pseudonocardiales bacterium]|jgi:hypothetical protein|nr:hypothetical protein [Pseudonocardiales bacterium]
MLGQKRNLWPYLIKWEAVAGRADKVQRLTFGTTVVADGRLARTLLTANRDDYQEQSGFLRIGAEPIGRSTRSQVVQRALSGLASHDLPRTYDLHSELTALGATSTRGLPHQGWGVRLMRRHFAAAMAYERDPRFQQLVDTYVEESVIPDDIRARRRGRYRAVDGVREELTCLFAAGQAVNDPPRDLIDAVSLADQPLTPPVMAELYQRLLLSMVGFTGVALEWVVLLAARNGVPPTTDEKLQDHIHETLRLHPTAWRLVRQARRDHAIGSHQLRSGEAVMIAIHAIHRDQSVWPQAATFRPSRWHSLSPDQQASFLPFGKGNEMCPASRFAIQALVSCAREIFQSYELSSHIRRRSRPRVLTLLAPPAGRTNLTPHVARTIRNDEGTPR